MGLDSFEWINKPEKHEVGQDQVVMTTGPKTDFWQRTYYGFQNDNAHAYVFKTDDDLFTFSVTAQFAPKAIYDQCGVVIYQDSENWFKGSIEYDTPQFSRLGSVVTNLGFSDWATTDIQVGERIRMVYRLSRRGSDFLLENAEDGKDFHQMRIFHLHKGEGEIRLGVYACSPLDSSIEAVFTEFHFGECVWDSYEAH